MKLGKTSAACHKALIFLKYKALLQIRENPNISESKNGQRAKMGHSQKKKLLTNEHTKSSALSISRKKNEACTESSISPIKLATKAFLIEPGFGEK